MAYSPPSITNINFTMASGYTPPAIGSISFDMSGGESGAPVNDTVSGAPLVDQLSAIITFGIVEPVGFVAGTPSVGQTTAENVGVPVDDTISGQPIVPAITAIVTSAQIDDILTGQPVIGSVTASNKFVFVFLDDTITGTPAVDSVVAFKPATILNNVIAGNPVIDTITADQISSAIPDVITGLPVLDSVVATILSGTVWPVGIVTGAPIVPSIIASIPTAGPISVITGNPVIGTLAASSKELVTLLSTLAYLCTLTGSPDITLPFSSFQCRLRSGAETYLQVVVPGFDWASEIDNRSDGQLVIEAAYFSDNTLTHKSEVVRVNLGTIRLDHGPFRKSITLSGYRQETYVPKARTLENPVYKLLNDGKIRYRFAEPDLYLNPGDTVTVGFDEFTANVVGYYVNAANGATRTQMEVSEE